MGKTIFRLIIKHDEAKVRKKHAPPTQVVPDKTKYDRAKEKQEARKRDASGLYCLVSLPSKEVISTDSLG